MPMHDTVEDDSMYPRPRLLCTCVEALRIRVESPIASNVQLYHQVPT